MTTAAATTIDLTLIFDYNNNNTFLTTTTDMIDYDNSTGLSVVPKCFI